jgi:hypothetical protein
VTYLYEEIHIELTKKEEKYWPIIGDNLSFDNSLINENDSGI